MPLFASSSAGVKQITSPIAAWGMSTKRTPFVFSFVSAAEVDQSTSCWVKFPRAFR